MDHRYTAIVRKATDSDYGVEFPDFPGCVTAGRTPEEAADLAGEGVCAFVPITKSIRHSNETQEVRNLDILLFLQRIPQAPQFHHLKGRWSRIENTRLRSKNAAGQGKQDSGGQKKMSRLSAGTG